VLPGDKTMKVMVWLRLKNQFEPCPAPANCSPTYFNEIIMKKCRLVILSQKTAWQTDSGKSKRSERTSLNWYRHRAQIQAVKDRLSFGKKIILSGSAE
jgi:hypothetical protein